MSPTGPTESATGVLDVSVTIEEQTVIEVEGERDLAVVVRSAAGEQIYLPPADVEERSDRGTPYESSDQAAASTVDTPYQSAVDSSYHGVSRDDQSPYDGVRQPLPTGLEPTGSGLRIVHPEPVTDLRIIR